MLMNMIWCACLDVPVLAGLSEFPGGGSPFGSPVTLLWWLFWAVLLRSSSGGGGGGGPGTPSRRGGPGSPSSRGGGMAGQARWWAGRRFWSWSTSGGSHRSFSFMRPWYPYTHKFGWLSIAWICLKLELLELLEIWIAWTCMKNYHKCTNAPLFMYF
jgi:hypothetical protein